ncbi:hypothetical protein CBP31_11590 [Oceanisphaera profunda]|uniref:ATP-dependent DNA helicase n=1 Tax=Oceanisphaera profunda TaxID=1416627 RepID=A0A1Y0D915_9GAMM|nr:hypothetical protein CBP31_11590 [Oceanisphaera profunda]
MAIAVRTLCEFAARLGSLEHSYTPSPTAIEGMAGHKKIQGRRGPDYQAEYLLTGDCLGITLRGRADGYEAKGYQAKGYQEYSEQTLTPLLEEIKTHRGEISRLGEGQRQLHWAQLKVYGALLCARDQLAQVRLRLLYYDIGKDLETPLEETWEHAELESFLHDLCTRYQDWHQQEQAHRVKRDQSLISLAFPFADFRTHQRHLSETVYKAISRAQSLQLEAPTGIGKTLGVAYPALMAMPRRGLDRLFMLSARTTGRQLMLDSLSKLKGPDDGLLPVRILELTARDKACLHTDLACHGESCPLASGFFDKLPKARQAAANRYWLDQTSINEIAAEHQLCPYYLAQEMARWSDVVVGDVNHYFDQQALLFGLSQQNEWRSVPLIDEAHNLIERARGMYSAALNQAQFSAAAKAAPASLKKTFTALQRAWKRLISAHELADSVAVKVGAEPQNHQLSTVPTELNGALQRLIGEITEHFSEFSPTPELQAVLFDSLAFLKLAEQFGEHSLCTLEVRTWTAGSKPRQSASLALQNLIPADFLAPRFAHAEAAILFSATLSPARYYHDLLGLPDSTCGQTIASPFSAQQLQLNVLNVSTRFKDRARSLPAISQRIAAHYQAKAGNYLVYLSSFAYLKQLQDYFQNQHPSLPCIAQTSGMSEAERLAFIERFRNGRGLVGFAVLGGAFSEGIDLPGDDLVGVFIATLGLPPFDDYHQQLAQRLAARFGSDQSYAYTYLYPGLRKVIQAAGRLIRTPDDTGVIELMDDRFNSPDIQRLLPTWWTENAHSQAMRSI